MCGVISITTKCQAEHHNIQTMEYQNAAKVLQKNKPMHFRISMNFQVLSWLQGCKSGEACKMSSGCLTVFQTGCDSSSPKVLIQSGPVIVSLFDDVRLGWQVADAVTDSVALWRLLLLIP